MAMLIWSKFFIMKKRQVIILLAFTGIIVLIASAVLMAPHQAGGMKGAGTAVAEQFVKVKTVKNDTIKLTIEAYGRVASTRNIILSAEVSGKLEEGSVPLKSGQRFSKGALLFSVNDTEQSLALQSRKSQFMNLIAAALPDLRLDFPANFQKWEQFFNALEVSTDLPKLPATNSTSEKTFLASRSILSEYYGIQSDEERLKKYKVVAPFSGSYTDVMVEVGAVVNTGAQVARIIQYNSLEVQVPVGVSEINFLKEGAYAELYNEEGNMKWTGEVIRIGRNVNQNTQSVDAYIRIEGEEKQSLFEGMYVKAVIYGKELTNVYNLSRKAVFDHHHVFVVEDSIMKIRSITIEKANELTFIVSGLKDEELLVVQPALSARENVKVVPIKE
jgi:membrane fusion protein (multidrug efflux system)